MGAYTKRENARLWELSKQMLLLVKTNAIDEIMYVSDVEHKLMNYFKWQN